MVRGWTPSLWLDIFDDMLEEEIQYYDRWSLRFNYSITNEVTNEERRKGWKEFRHCAFGGFRCGSCSRTWSSARAMLLFRYRLRGNRGAVTLRPFGQACRHCRNAEFELPGFSQQEVEEALLKLFRKIRKNCYHEEEDDNYSATLNPVRTKPHEKTLCEACIKGLYCQRD